MEKEKWCGCCGELFFTSHSIKKYCSIGCQGKQSERRRSKQSKIDLFNLLGNKCCECKISDSRVLQIDHVDGGGKKELTNSGNRRMYYRRLIREIKDGSKKYQILCANCNWIKRHTNDEK